MGVEEHYGDFLAVALFLPLAELEKCLGKELVANFRAVGEGAQAILLNELDARTGEHVVELTKRNCFFGFEEFVGIIVKIGGKGSVAHDFFGHGNLVFQFFVRLLHAHHRGVATNH